MPTDSPCSVAREAASDQGCAATDGAIPPRSARNIGCFWVVHDKLDRLIDGYRPCVRVFMQRTSGFVTGSLWPGFTVPPPHPPGLPRHLTHDLTALHVLNHSLSFGPSSFWLGLISHRLELLRPLLTSRSSLRCRPFRHKARSP